MGSIRPRIDHRWHAPASPDTWYLWWWYIHPGLYLPVGILQTEIEKGRNRSRCWSGKANCSDQADRRCTRLFAEILTGKAKSTPFLLIFYWHKRKSTYGILRKCFIFKWEQQGSNLWPSACKADALNQLSYAPNDLFFNSLAQSKSADFVEKGVQI